MRIGDLAPDPYFSDEEVEYISLDKPMDETRVLAARINKAKLAKEPTKEPVKQILRRRIQKESEYAAPKNVRFGEWKPIKHNLLSGTTLTPIAFAVSEKPMPDLEGGVTKKNVERKKHFRVVNVLKKSVRATTIIKRILDVGVNIAVSKLLASVAAVEKQLTKAISKDEAILF